MVELVDWLVARWFAILRMYMEVWLATNTCYQLTIG